MVLPDYSLTLDGNIVHNQPFDWRVPGRVPFPTEAAANECANGLIAAYTAPPEEPTEAPAEA